MRFDLLKSEKFKTWNDTRDTNQILLHPLESVLSVTRSLWLNHFFRYLHRLHIWLGCMLTVSARHSSRYPPLVNLSPSRRQWLVAFSNFPSHSQVFPHEKNFLDVTWLITNFFFISSLWRRTNAYRTIQRTDLEAKTIQTPQTRCRLSNAWLLGTVRLARLVSWFRTRPTNFPLNTCPPFLTTTPSLSWSAENRTRSVSQQMRLKNNPLFIQCDHNSTQSPFLVASALFRCNCGE